MCYFSYYTHHYPMSKTFLVVKDHPSSLADLTWKMTLDHTLDEMQPTDAAF